MTAGTLTPLAERMRPAVLSELVGLATIVEESAVASVLSGTAPPNLLFWGPPGCGKTTLAYLIGKTLGLTFHSLSAIQVGVKEIRALLEPPVSKAAQTDLFQKPGKSSPSGTDKPPLLFLDEIHHFNKNQQDVLLRDLEEGKIFLIGATTENPSFALNSALLSRLSTIVLPAASATDVAVILNRALSDERGLQGRFGAQPELMAVLAESTGGDYRQALGLLEQVAGMAERKGMKELTRFDLTQLLHSNPLHYDRAGDRHFDMISAMIKSLRGSDADAALYWCAAMYEAGEDPLYLLRRLVVFASEDIGNADPAALPLAMAAHQAYERLGRAEGWIPLAQAVTYLATAPKSKAAYSAWQQAAAVIRSSGTRPEVPWHLRNKPTRLLKELAAAQNGSEYHDPHGYPYGFAPDVDYLPDTLQRSKTADWYQPVERGFEKTLRERQTFFQRLRREARTGKDREVR